MATLFDNIFGDLAVKLIDNTFGTSATFTRETSTYDVATGLNTKRTTNYDVKISPPTPFTQDRWGDDSRFQMDDAVCMVARKTLPVEPNPTSDTLLFRSRRYQIVKVMPIASGDEDAAYELVIRR